MRPSHTLSTTGIVTATVLAVALGGCTGGSSPSPSSSSMPATTTSSPTSPPSASPTSSSSTSPSPTASVPPGFSLDEVTSPTFPDLGGDLGGIGVVRVGHHPTYDRVVWQFPGSGRPTYRVHYVDQPVADGSGDVVKVAGDAYLEVMITFVGVPAEGTAQPKDASAASMSGTNIAAATAIYGGFEGYGQAFVGVRGEQRPFKVTVLKNPTRLVLDVYSG
jgi:hypothetical protein